MSNYHRSKDAPMDYEYTDRQEKPAVWAQPEDPRTPQKRDHATANAPTPLHTPAFGGPMNVPFMFHDSPKPSPQPYPWTPPPNFSANKMFQQDVKDVDMADASPPQPVPGGSVKTDQRLIATGGMRRVYKSRQQQRSGLSQQLPSRGQNDGDADSQESDDEQSVSRNSQVTQNTSNHYTLNLPSPAAPQSDTPYILLGYLQFFFNLSLVLIFLYLAIQFILTVQRDVEHRITEYTMDIIQEISQCALQFKNNNCDEPIPAMVKQCGNWETCMNRDPTTVGRARVGAELIAEVVNGFVEPISWKTLAFTLTSLSFLTVFINTLLSLYRSRLMPQSVAPVVPPQPMPYAHPYGYFSPATTPSWGKPGWREGTPETPTRRRRLSGGATLKVK